MGSTREASCSVGWPAVWNKTDWIECGASQGDKAYISFRYWYPKCAFSESGIQPFLFLALLNFRRLSIFKSNAVCQSNSLHNVCAPLKTVFGYLESGAPLRTPEEVLYKYSNEWMKPFDLFCFRSSFVNGIDELASVKNVEKLKSSLHDRLKVGNTNWMIIHHQ